MRIALGAYHGHREWPSIQYGVHLRVGVTFDEAVTAFGDPLGASLTTLDTRRQSSALCSSATRRLADSWRSCSPSAVTAFALSAPGPRPVANAATMKKPAKRRPRIDRDEILPEYDFSQGRRNPYAARMAGATLWSSSLMSLRCFRPPRL